MIHDIHPQQHLVSPGCRRRPTDIPTRLPSLDVGLLAHAPQVGEQQLYEEVGLLRIGHPQNGAAVARLRIVAARREAIADVQHLSPCQKPPSVL